MNKLPRKYIVYILFMLVGIALLAILPTSCTCNCSSNDGIGGGWNPLYHRFVFSRSYTVIDDSEIGMNHLSDIYVVTSNGLVNLTDTTEEYASGPQWSPDGTKIAFISPRVGERDIYVMNADGSDIINLTDTPDQDEDISPQCSCWSPDGTKILFEYGDEGVYVMDADGTNKTNLANAPDVYEFNACWLSDGTKIAYQVWISSGSYDLYIMDADGSSKTKLASGSRFMWSPDGSKVAVYTGVPFSYGAMYVMDSDGSNQTVITDSGFVTSYTRIWSPDGSKLAFCQSNVEEETTDIFVVNADGLGLTNLTNTPEILEYSPQWSPDGTKIAFNLFDEGDEGVYVMDADGSNLIPLAVPVHPETVEPDELIFPRYRFPVWSQDGLKIALICRDDIENSGLIDDIYVVNSDGSDLVKVTDFSHDFQQRIDEQSLKWSR